MKLSFCVPVLAVLAQSPGPAQQTHPPLTLRQTVEQAIQNYPSVRAAGERASAASAGTDLARTAYLPRADFLGQVDRATRNNVFGLLLPQQVLPSISGPVLGTNGLTSVWGSAVGVLVSWEPFDFGLRRANVEATESSAARARAVQDVTRLQIGTAAADAFLGLLAAQQKAVSARAGVDRSEVVSRVADGLAAAGLRPGADAARARAELAAAQAQLIRAEEEVELARVSLAHFLGIPASETTVEPGVLLEKPPEGSPPVAAPATHPVVREQNAAVETARAAERAAARSYFPRFNLQAASYARGTGARPDGSTGGAAAGLGPNTQNWAAGLSVTFPAFDLAANRARRQAALHQERSEEAQYQKTLRDVETQDSRARVELDGARRLADISGVQVEAAREAERQAAARYKAGLGSIAEVADAERLLTEAETGDALARLGVWRGLLAVAAASGDLEPFLQRAGR